MSADRFDKDDAKELNASMLKLLDTYVQGKAIIENEDGTYTITDEGQTFIDMLEMLDMLRLVASDKRLYIAKVFLKQSDIPNGRGVLETTDQYGRNIRIKPRQKTTAIDVRALRQDNPELFKELAERYPVNRDGRAETIEVSGEKEHDRSSDKNR